MISWRLTGMKTNPIRANFRLAHSTAVGFKAKNHLQPLATQTAQVVSENYRVYHKSKSSRRGIKNTDSDFFNNPGGVGFICCRNTLKQDIVDVLLTVTALKNTETVLIY